MTNDERDLLHSLRRQQGDLQVMMDRLHAQLQALEKRVGVTAPNIADLPPVPPDAWLPPVPLDFQGEDSLPPVPADAALPHLLPAPISSPEMHLGRWVLRFGVLLVLLTVLALMAFVDVHWQIDHRMGPLGHLAMLGLTSALAITIGQRLDKREGGLRYLGRGFIAAGLGALYVTFYDACYNPDLKVIGGPLTAGVLLIVWSVYALLLAERKKSQTLGIIAIGLAYFGTAMNPSGAFTMGTNLVLAIVSAAFLLRNGWVLFGAVSVAGAYLALLRRLIIDDTGAISLDTSQSAYGPPAIYLTMVWVIFTFAVIFTSDSAFRGAKRFAFVFLNNAGVAGLLGLNAYIAGYGASAIGWTLFDTGLVFLVMSRFAGFAVNDPVDLMSMYAAQGLALVTAGIIVIFTGTTRVFLLLLETFLLGVAGAFAGDRILTISTYIIGFFATTFAIWQMTVYAHHPWLFGFGGALILLINAWNSRGEIRNSPSARTTLVFATCCDCVLATGLIFTALCTIMGDATLPPALAIAALGLTFVIYYFAIFELPNIAQVLLLAALCFVLFPVETGERLPWWSLASVGAITLLLLTWWSRQRTTRPGGWIGALKFLYAVGLSYLAVIVIRPNVDAQGWMVCASLLSWAFLYYGASCRVWILAAVGQVFLVLALYHLFFPPHSGVFPWEWWAAAVPVVVTFISPRYLALSDDVAVVRHPSIQYLAYGYKLVALAGAIRCVFGLVPEMDRLVAAFLFLGTFLLSINVRRSDSFGVRCSFVLSVIGILLYTAHVYTLGLALATGLNALAMFLLLSQTALLRRGKGLVTSLEVWSLTVFAAATCWLFVSVWVWTKMGPRDLTLGWTLFAFFLFIFGMITHVRRLRWCGLFILGSAMLRVLCCDLWYQSAGMKVVTLFLLALVVLIIGFAIFRRGLRQRLDKL